jgi:hypothetical protein
MTNNVNTQPDRRERCRGARPARRIGSHKPGPNDLRFMSGPSPRPSKEAFGSDYASLAEKHAETRPPGTAAARVPCDRHIQEPQRRRDRSFGQPSRRSDGENLARAGFNAEEIIGKIPILPRGYPGPPGDDKIDFAKAFHERRLLECRGQGRLG